MRIRVGHLYPDYLNIYADRGNIAVLARRAALRGLELEVARDRPRRDARARRARPALRRRRPGPRAGADRARHRRQGPGARRGGRGRSRRARRLRRLPAARPLLPRPLRLGAARRRRPAAAHGRGRAADDRRRPARVRVRAGERRDAGRVREPRRADVPRRRAPSRSAAWSPASGTTATSGFEGCRAGRVVGTYLHGPLLPRNPWLADWLLAQAAAHRTGGEPPVFEPLDDGSRPRRTPSRPRRARARGGALPSASTRTAARMTAGRGQRRPERDVPRPPLRRREPLLVACDRAKAVPAVEPSDHAARAPSPSHRARGSICPRGLRMGAIANDAPEAPSARSTLERRHDQQLRRAVHRLGRRGRDPRSTTSRSPARRLQASTASAAPFRRATNSCFRSGSSSGAVRMNEFDSGRPRRRAPALQHGLDVRARARVVEIRARSA